MEMAKRRIYPLCVITMFRNCSQSCFHYKNAIVLSEMWWMLLDCEKHLWHEDIFLCESRRHYLLFCHFCYLINSLLLIHCRTSRLHCYPSQNGFFILWKNLYNICLSVGLLCNNNNCLFRVISWYWRR